MAAIEGYTEQTAPYVADVVSAFCDAYVTIGKIHEATAAGKKNPAWTDEMRVLYPEKYLGRILQLAATSRPHTLEERAGVRVRKLPGLFGQLAGGQRTLMAGRTITPGFQPATRSTRKLTISIAPELHRALEDYARVYKDARRCRAGL
jgi:hypothetical protein